MLNYEGSGSRGDQGTVLLLHAFPVSAAMWKPQIEFLEAAGYGVVAPHVFGFEGSPARLGWSMDEYAAELAALLDARGIDKVTVAGLSMGGYQAFAFWRLYPARTASIVLCDTRANADAPEAYALRMEFRKAIEEHGAPEAANRMVPNFFSSQAGAELADTARKIIERQSASAISEAMRAIAERPDSTGLLGHISCPVLILNGDADVVTTPETAAAMQAQIPGSKLEIIPEAGHLSNLEQPARFNSLLLEHLKSL